MNGTADSFPNELPVQAVRQITKFVTKQDPDVGRAALAAWQILGYAGYQALGDVQFMTGQEIDVDSVLPPIPTQLPAEPELVGIADGSEPITAIPPWVIPLAVNLLLRLIERFKS